MKNKVSFWLYGSGCVLCLAGAFFGFACSEIEWVITTFLPNVDAPDNWAIAFFWITKISMSIAVVSVFMFILAMYILYKRQLTNR